MRQPIGAMLQDRPSVTLPNETLYATDATHRPRNPPQSTNPEIHYSTTPPLHLSTPLKILILKPSSLGDVVQALPVLRMLKRHLPHSEIFWWIESSLAPLLEGDPDLTGLCLFDRKGWRQPAWWPTMWSRIRAVRQMRFDLVLDLQGLSRSAFFAWLANGEITIGLDNPREGNREGAQIFYDLLAPRSPPGTPAPTRYLSVLAALGLAL